MKREIKFRVWDISLKKFIPFNGYWCNFDDPQYVCQQFTGLEDSRGTEIYEGDVVEFRSMRNSEDAELIKGQVKWGDYSDDEYVENLECWMVSGEGIFNLPLSCAIQCCGVAYGRGTEVAPNTARIIGNIFENPELLKYD